MHLSKKDLENFNRTGKIKGNVYFITKALQLIKETPLRE